MKTDTQPLPGFYRAYLCRDARPYGRKIPKDDGHLLPQTVAIIPLFVKGCDDNIRDFGQAPLLCHGILLQLLIGLGLGEMAGLHK